MTFEEWMDHFNSVLHDTGEYALEFWTIKKEGPFWVIIGNDTGLRFSSYVNGERDTYSDINILARECTLLDIETRNLLYNEITP